MQDNHAVTLLVSVDQQIRPVTINADENYFIRGHRTANQLIGVTGCEDLSNSIPVSHALSNTFF